MKDFSAVVVSAGKGHRFGQKKQFCLLDQLPLFFHSYLAFQNLLIVKEIIFVIDERERDRYLAYFERLAASYPIRLPYKFVSGGEERYQSVFNGLKQCQKVDGVMIHDVARPIIRKGDLMLLFQTLARQENVVGVAPIDRLSDSIKRVDSQGKVIDNLNRDELAATSTPQGFYLSNLIKANLSFHQNRSRDKIPTDDVEIFIKSGFSVQGVRISHPNPKVTYRQDLDLVERIYFRDEIYKERVGLKSRN